MNGFNARIVLPYRDRSEDRRVGEEEFWGGVADVIVPVAYWGLLAAVTAAFVGAVVLWGVLISLVA